MQDKMKKNLIAVLPGDGIGPEVVKQAVKVITYFNDQDLFPCELEEKLIGGTAYDAEGKPLPDDTLALAKKSDAVLLGAVGGTKWESLDYSVRPERALLSIRKELNLFANLRPAKVFAELAESSTLKTDIVSGVDLMVVRELTGGIYFGEPRGVQEEGGQRVGRNTLVYSESEIKRIAKVALEIASLRQSKLCSVDKANVLETTELWREIVEEEHKNYASVELTNMYVDNAAMQLIRDPNQFDVIVTGNLFGDILSDAAAMLTGSIGMLPSASLDEDRKGMYEPVHGSAPDIAGKDRANPLATILSVAMMFAYTFDRVDLSDLINQAVQQVLKDDYRTRDINQDGMKLVGCEEMGDLVVGNLYNLASKG